jgi:hypothetical protein
MPCKRSFPENAAKSAVSGVFYFPEFTGFAANLKVSRDSAATFAASQETR